MLRVPKNRITTHPGVVLAEDFLAPLGISQSELARHIGKSVQVVNEIVRGKRGVSSEMAILLSQALNTSPEFWINLNAMHELSKAVQQCKGPKVKPLRPTSGPPTPRPASQ